MWLNDEKLDALRTRGFTIGNNVKISDKVDIDCRYLKIGDYSRIDAFVFLSGTVCIGRFTHIAPHCVFSCSEGLTVGDLCGFSPFNYIMTNSANFKNESLSLPTVPKAYKRAIDKGPVKIGNHVILGARCTTFPNTTITSGAKFGSGSLIKGDYNSVALCLSEGNKIAKFYKLLSMKILEDDAARLYNDLGCTTKIDL